jgi:hypothetical protein
MKPSRSADQHKGYYGAEPIKEKEGTGGVKVTRVGMKPAIKEPCRECPLRRDSVPGYLGGYTPKMYTDIMHGPASIACHSSEGFHEGQIEKQRHCTGVAAYRANVGHICAIQGRPTAAHTSTQLIGHDEEHYFASPEEFVAHHEPGQKK